MTRVSHPDFPEWLPALTLHLPYLRVRMQPHTAALQTTNFIAKLAGLLVIFLTLWTPLIVAQQQTDPDPKKEDSRFIDNFFNFLNMAGTEKSNEFRPMNQHERNALYFKTMVNPFSFIKVAFSAGIDQANDKPTEWGQGAAGYGKRSANILGQYSIQRTVTYGLGSLFHEDNRYFNSGKQGFWPRTGYAVSSGILARHDDGTRHFSISQVGGVAAGAFLARAWLPPSQSSARDGAVSFGITTASNMGFSVMKEFLPDLGRALAKKRKKKPVQ